MFGGVNSEEISALLSDGEIRIVDCLQGFMSVEMSVLLTDLRGAVFGCIHAVINRSVLNGPRVCRLTMW